MKAPIGATGVVYEANSRYDENYLPVIWDENYGQADGHYWPDYFELARPRTPTSFSITLKFLDIDAALEATEQLASKFGPIQIQPGYDND